MDDSQFQTLVDFVDAQKPLGDWDNKPAVAATTVAMTNNSGFPMWVLYDGGTVTALKVDGVTLGALTTGWVRVRNGSTTAWVGSAAPTMQWFYE
jgi:hypothetical protein